MIREPHPLIGPSRQSAWQNAARRNAVASRVGFPAGVTMARTSKGTVFHAQGGNGVPGESKINVAKFKIVSIGANSLVTVKDGDPVTTQTSILLPTKLRGASYHGVSFSIPAITGLIDAMTLSYSYVEPQFRIVNLNSGQATSYEVIVPRYLVDDYIYAVEFDETITWQGGSETYSWLDLNLDGRSWGRTQ